MILKEEKNDILHMLDEILSEETKRYRGLKEATFQYTRSCIVHTI